MIEEMITGGVLELLVGIVSDPAYGPVLTIAEGGTYTELLQDKVTPACQHAPVIFKMPCKACVVGQRRLAIVGKKVVISIS